MKTEKIAYDNGMFFILTVGMCLGFRAFKEAVLDSFNEEVLFPTDPIRDPGYIKIDVSAIKEKGYSSDFTEKVVGAKILELCTYGFSSGTKFEGDLNERVMIKKDGYEFHFEIKEYERSIDHGFEIIKPEALADVPEDEQLGRLVYLTIKPKD